MLDHGGLRKMSSLFSLVLLISLSWVSGCGYTFQNSRNLLAEKENVQKIYIPPVVNNTYKVGIENVVYNHLLKTLLAYGKVTLVHHPEEADALLQGSVQTASFGVSASTSVSQLNPLGLGAQLPTAQFSVATEYMAILACGFSLVKRGPLKQSQSSLGVIWSSSFARSKPFPALNQLDVLGTTSALMNESEFDRALGDLAKSMMDDVHESMLSMF
ncbi:MAG: LPS assembly lipoprotein LptE [Bdellovibrionia bacterium]